MDITTKYEDKTDAYELTLLQITTEAGVKVRATLKFAGENVIHLTAPTSSPEATEELLAKIPKPDAKPQAVPTPPTTTTNQPKPTS
jgi:hypothetical protein